MKKGNLILDEAISLYKTTGSLHKTAKLLHTSHIRLSQFLQENGIPITNIGKRKDITVDIESRVMEMYSIGETIGSISEKLHITYKKVSKTLRKKGISVNRWHNHTKAPKPPVKPRKPKQIKPTMKCPYCGWETHNFNPRNNAYVRHILEMHGVTVEEHLSNFPEDRPVFETLIKKREGKIQCKICGKFLSLIDDRHLLQKHGITKQEYIERYGYEDLISVSCKTKLQQCMEKMQENPNWERFCSTYETSIQDFLTEHGISFVPHDRNILKPYELDILIPDHNLAIEFNGNKHHTEWAGGKSRQYHLNKTKACKEKGIALLHIFEDEYHNSKDIVLNKISHILGIQHELPKIMGRKCSVKEIDKASAQIFLENYHIQGYDPSTVHYGAFYDSTLVAVMSFLKNNKNDNAWELTRFASDYNYICCGVGGKLFKHFVRHHNPVSVKSFADRRWTVDETRNIYIQMGFNFEGYTPPDYKYYNPFVNKHKRFHKFGFRKKTLLKKYPSKLSPDMTETEMAKALGFDRIWDCGLIKYVWHNSNVNDK